MCSALLPVSYYGSLLIRWKFYKKLLLPGDKEAEADQAAMNWTFGYTKGSCHHTVLSATSQLKQSYTYPFVQRYWCSKMQQSVILIIKRYMNLYCYQMCFNIFTSHNSLLEIILCSTSALGTQQHAWGALDAQSRTDRRLVAVLYCTILDFLAK